MNTYDIKPLEAIDRSVTEVSTEAETYIEVEVTQKEAVDVDNALGSLLKEALSGDYKNAEQVSNFVRLWKGRCRASPTIMITDHQEAEITLDALERFDADELDTTDRVHDALVEILDETTADL